MINSPCWECLAFGILIFWRFQERSQLQPLTALGWFQIVKDEEKCYNTAPNGQLWMLIARKSIEKSVATCLSSRIVLNSKIWRQWNVLKHRRIGQTILKPFLSKNELEPVAVSCSLSGFSRMIQTIKKEQIVHKTSPNWTKFDSRSRMNQYDHICDI